MDRLIPVFQYQKNTEIPNMMKVNFTNFTTSNIFCPMTHYELRKSHNISEEDIYTEIASPVIGSEFFSLSIPTDKLGDF